MQFNGSTNGIDLAAYANSRTGATDSTFPLSEKAMYASQAEREILGWIFDSYGFAYDASTNTDLPQITADLESGKSFYALPPEIGKIMSVSVRNAGGNWKKLGVATLGDIERSDAEPAFMDQSGEPAYYMPIANGFKIYPASNADRTDSIEVQISKDISPYAPTDTVRTPGYDRQFHEASGVYMALQYAKNNQLEVRVDLQREWDGNEAVTGREGGYKKSIKKWYLSKFSDAFPPNIRKSDFSLNYL
jgi:hypothetical protein